VNQRAVNDQEYRGLAGVAAGQVVFAAVFVFLLLSAFHRPAPHALPVGVVAAPAIARQLQVTLDAHEPGGFGLRSYPDAARARLGVTGGHVDGALVVAPRSLRLLTAGARDTTASSMSALRGTSADQAKPQTYVSPQRIEEASVILVTGTAGRAGGQVVSQLQDRKTPVRAVAGRSNRISEMWRYHVPVLSLHGGDRLLQADAAVTAQRRRGWHVAPGPGSCSRDIRGDAAGTIFLSAHGTVPKIRCRLRTWPYGRYCPGL
jgi:hypothetical protein